MHELRRGVFIALEGVDGAGSSTQTKMLVDMLVDRGFDAVATKEPNPDGFIEPVIRRFLSGSSETPALDALLFAADRIDHVEHFIKPWLIAKKVVVSDRYIESSIAYQTSQGLSESWVISINRGAIKPDATLIMDIDPVISLRRKTTSPERYEREEFLGKVRSKFLERASKKGYDVIDASLPIDSVHANIVKSILPLIVSVSRKP
ncbi:MAG: dTMP kinase [Candidatus Methanomethylicus sp.]|nr:dTMP kinase [Candidatus Methanomethylicus sp.]